MSEVENFLARICELFPEVRSRIEQRAPDMPTSRMEEFANCTTQALGQEDVSRAVEYMEYMSNELHNATEKEREYIDVYFVECLFWQAPKATIKRGWPLVPKNLKELYVAFHGAAPV